jgi:ribose transport system ATP-binding protein
VIDDISIDFYAAETHVLLGSNGAGKSTLVNIVSGREWATRGEIVFEGQPLAKYSIWDALQKGIAICTQEMMVFDELSVIENLFLGREIRSAAGLLDWRAMEKKTCDVLKRLKLDINPYKPLRKISAAEKKLVEFGRILIMNPKLVILDELTDSLTLSECQTILGLLDDLKRSNVAVIYITHRIDEALSIADRITIIKDGRIVKQLSGKQFTKDQIVVDMLGEPYAIHYPKLLLKRGEPILEAINVSTNLVEDISFSLHRGELLGIAGLVGSGRTSLLRAVAGLDKLAKGEIVLYPEDDKRRTNKGFRKHIAFLPEDRDKQGLFLKMATYHNITIKRLNRVKRNSLIAPSLEMAASRDIMNRLGIKAASIKNKVVYLSGGNKQKVLLGRNIFAHCEIFILDEPTKGVDIAGKVEIYNIINELLRKGAGIIIVSSDFPELAGMCDQIFIIKKGRIQAKMEQNNIDRQKLFDISASDF